MRSLRHSKLNSWIAVFLICGLLNLGTGCAAIFSGTSENVRVITHPEGGTVEYKGMKVKDGEVITVQKHFEDPRFNVGSERRPVMVSMTYSPDAWLIGDCVLLVFFIIPGLVALGVDFGTGAWRNLDDPQHVYTYSGQE